MFVQAREETGGTINYYFLKDHLGNVRVTFKDNNGTAEVVSAKDYYPFGSVMRSMQAIPDEQDKWKYQGKERDLETSYDYFEARIYDSAIGMFRQIDPKVDEFVTMSGYTGMGNNPINTIDPDGERIRIYYQQNKVDENGDIVRDEDGNAITETKYHDYVAGAKYEGGNDYVAAVIGVLNVMLNSEITDLSQAITDLSKSDNLHSINETNSTNSDDTNSKSNSFFAGLRDMFGYSTGSDISWNKNYSHDTGYKRQSFGSKKTYDTRAKLSPESILVHELHHSWKIFEKGAKANLGTLKKQEINASKFANKYRAISGQKPRIVYGGWIIGK